MSEFRFAIRCTITVAVLLASGAAHPPRGEAQSVCDVDADGAITVSDGVQVLRAAAELPTSCSLAACDANGDDTITVGDGVNVLRSAAELPSACDAANVPTPTVTPTPRGPASATVEACDDDCRAALQVCGGDIFFEDYETVEACTEECVVGVEDYASDVADFQGCVDAQVRFIACCTDRRQCGEIPDGCDSEFSGAVVACGGAFGGCPMIFFDVDDDDDDDED